MNIKINRETLLKPLTAVSGIVERRHTLPILSNLLLEAKQDKIVLTATDLEMQISLSTPSSTGGELSTTVSAKKLLDICRALPEDAEITMATWTYQVGRAFSLTVSGALGRLIKGPTLPDRVVAMDLIGVLVVSLIVVVAAYSDVRATLDAALVIALIGFLGTLGYATYIDRRDQQ